MRIHGTLAALAAAAVVASGCGGDSTGPSAVTHVGRYGLVTVDGAPLPLSIIDTPTLKLTVTKGAWTFNADNSFSEEIDFEVVANGFPAPPETGICLGTYQRSGNSFTMTATPGESCVGGTSTGTLDGRTLTVSADGSSLVFRR